MMPTMAAMPLKMRMYKGDVGTQAESVFKKHVAALTEAGLTAKDAFFSRNILYPDPKNGGRMDFASFNKAYSAIYNNPDNPNRLARTVMSAPGYAMQGQLLAVETYAAYSGDTAKLFAPVAEGGKPAALKAFRADPKAIASSGVATSPAAALTWVSGLIAPERGEMKAEASAVFVLAKERLAAVGGDFSNVVQLRAYVAAGANAVTAVSDFEAVYATTFAGDHKPAVTILPVKALANNAKVEVEILAATVNPAP
jgi:enamine deaminase RidA (YjgF/YER057c/UK114 family)